MSTSQTKRRSVLGSWFSVNADGHSSYITSRVHSLVNRSLSRSTPTSPALSPQPPPSSRSTPVAHWLGFASLPLSEAAPVDADLIDLIQRKEFYDAKLLSPPASPSIQPAQLPSQPLLVDKMRSRNKIKSQSRDSAILPQVKPNTEKVVQFVNCDVLRDGKITRDETLWIQGGKIVDASTSFFAGIYPDEVVDFGNRKRRPLIVPGFIDVQINGYFGYDFAERDRLEEGLEVVAKGLLKYGVTSFLPTVVTSLPETYSEGPFIAPTRKGAHNVDYFRTTPNGVQDLIDVYGKYIEPGNESTSDRHKCGNLVKIVTVAPELDGMLDAIAGLKKRLGDDVIVSIGHTESTYEIAEQALEAGASMITHLFNAMHPFYHRDPGPMGVIGLPVLPHNTNKPYFGLIVDGVHTDPSSVRVAYSSYPEGAILVTDAMAGAGLEGDAFMLGSMQVVRKGPMEVVIKGTNTLAGSVATMPFCISNMVKFADCSLADAINAATVTPAKSLGLYAHKGSLLPGADADLVILDGFDDNDDSIFEVSRVFVAGEEVFRL
ncbi:hypothetical protein BC830DRAFT_600304 [Chytriomyces sp. MP71]|nr:hypothetical protein BC830DRAFT_600304 [Chytriomyces sp. MP71]